MTHVIITTETADEMKALLALARRNKFKFKAVAIKEKNTSASIGKPKLTSEEENLALAKAMDEGRSGEFVPDKDIFKLFWNKCLT